ncbi:MAG: hypothetical protein M1399_09085 [Actinobacteria bacterium]|nr:hypothetical protein [Actinomycetota bacterium]MCL5446859.1 hypothetical protein [Actinomycetota bacterium]
MIKRIMIKRWFSHSSAWRVARSGATVVLPVLFLAGGMIGMVAVNAYPSAAAAPSGPAAHAGLARTAVSATGASALAATAAGSGATSLYPPSPVCVQSCQKVAAPGSESNVPAMSDHGSLGMNLAQAYTKYTTGSPNVVVAYVEGGVNWQLSGAQSLSNNMYLNWHNLPVPCTGATLATATMVINGVTEKCHLYYSNNFANYDIDHDGVIRAGEWAHDPRVTDANHNGYIDPEDLIAAFSNGHGNGPYPNDISGWNFYRNTNDPATANASYQHSDQMMGQILSVCPSCSILPVKAGNEAVDATENLAKAWMYAYHAGARVIVSVTADLGFSNFMRQTIDYLYSKGVVMVEASNDFDSTDHQGGMFWPHVIPGNGAIPALTGNSWTRSDMTSWGPHNMFTAPNEASTSLSTATIGGAMGLLLSWGNEAYDRHLIPQPLTGPQAIQVLRATATPVTNPQLSWPGSPGHWNMQYGYGIPNIPAAMAAVAAGQIPPVPSISSPSWYSMWDPTVQQSVPVTGTISAASGQKFTWEVQAGIGAQPSSNAWFTIGSGTGSGSFSGTLGVLDLSKIPRSYWSAPFRQAQTKFLNSTEQYAVSLRVTVTASNGQVGVTRRAINVVHASNWMAGFPMHFRSSIEGTPALVDLQGTGRLDMVFGTTGGYIHAIDPATGKELPGWPVHTLPVRVPLSFPGMSTPYQPIFTPVAVGSLYNNGNLSVVATTLEGYTYVFNAQGQLQPGWPKRVGRNLPPWPVPVPTGQHVRQPVAMALAAPVLADLQGNGELDIVQAGMDGYIHAWTPAGSDVPGWPVQVKLPAGFKLQPGYFLENDKTLISTPTVAHLQNSHSVDIVERSQFAQLQGIGMHPYGMVFAYQPDGKPVPGWPVTLPGTLEVTDVAMQFLTEGSASPVAVPLGANGTDQVAAGPVFTPPYRLGGNGTILGTFGSAQRLIALMQQLLDGNITVTGEQSVVGPVPFSSSGAFGRFGGQLVYAQGGTGLAHVALALAETNKGLGMAEYMNAYPANSLLNSKSLSGFPAVSQGWSFLSSPVFAGVTSGGHMSIIQGGDAEAIDAFMPGGKLAPGFPLFTGGWTVYSPSTGDLLSNGQLDLVDSTREGYLLAWTTPGSPASNNQWWHWHHDEYNSGLYGLHTRPPGVARSVSWTAATSKLSFVAPGSRWYTGEVSGYRMTFNGLKSTLSAPGTGATTVIVRPSGPAGTVESVPVPAGSTSVTVQAVNGSGLNGHVETMATPGASAPLSALMALVSTSQVKPAKSTVQQPGVLRVPATHTGEPWAGYLWWLLDALVGMAGLALLVRKGRAKSLQAKQGAM